ncbi:hypothetical protein [Bradyrhizobium sp. sBnM-33]|uniref:hypothetical protein n=1 Tax=Bradyrhizobium sp. sBnM-33 TaxID=2831780 RepID=UPI001BCB3598|nr:hypothetical protein [Bradyrhizobium sp. sBnM-33]
MSCSALSRFTLRSTLPAKGLPWRIALFDPPLGVLLAMPMLTIKIGAIISLGAALAFRLFVGGHRMPLALVALLLAVIVILLIGALWLIRVLTCSRWCERAWVGSAALSW